jgi:hypothetical protein
MLLTGVGAQEFTHSVNVQILPLIEIRAGKLRIVKLATRELPRFESVKSIGGGESFFGQTTLQRLSSSNSLTS